MAQKVLELHPKCQGEYLARDFLANMGRFFTVCLVNLGNGFSGGSFNVCSPNKCPFAPQNDLPLRGIDACVDEARYHVNQHKMQADQKGVSDTFLEDDFTELKRYWKSALSKI